MSGMTRAGQFESGDLVNQRAIVLGLGREGRDLVRFLTTHGAQVLATDSRSETTLEDALASLDGLPVMYRLGGHELSDLDHADVVFASPGVSPQISFLQEARRRGVRVSSATELFFQLCPGSIIGITGSSGKSTTTALTGAILNAAGRNPLIGGNIGIPLLKDLEVLSASSWIVMELSSFQLEFMTASPSIATITNLTPNHLDRHITMEAYGDAKARILASQDADDWAILNQDDQGSRRFVPRGRSLSFSLEKPTLGAYLQGSQIMIDRGDRAEAICSRDEIGLRGTHNVANVLAASATASAAGVDVAHIREAVMRFVALPHRIEPVATVEGVTYYNDSIATSPERSIAALQSFNEPVILLAGGKDKNLPMDDWAALIRQRTRQLIVFGDAQELIASAALRAGVPVNQIIRTVTMDEAITAASAIARAGEVVLLSPGCTSYDAFFDFEERGERFRQRVHELEGSPSLL
jgi:UDP-N-acetylmuramoylalanine--D-glutamate ligase